jgi:hypothetical protein
MAAAFTTTGAAVSVGGVIQTSGVTSNDFTNPVTYRVTAADGSWQDYTVTVIFAPAIGCLYVSGNSTIWNTTASTTTDSDYMILGLTCDAINPGTDTFTVYTQIAGGLYTPSVPMLTVPSDTTVTNTGGDVRIIQIVGPLNSIRNIIGQLKFVPPDQANEILFYIKITDKNGLIATGRLTITITSPDTQL